MEMTQIKYVLAAARSLNFTRAAHDCNVSQPALTKGVKALEEELGGLIFHREGKRILLSEFGHSILPRLHRIVDETEATRTLASNYRLLRRVPVRLGVMSTVGSGRLSRFIGKVGRDHDGLELSVSEHPLAELVDRLGKGELDVAILNHAYPLHSGAIVCDLTCDLEADHGRRGQGWALAGFP